MSRLSIRIRLTAWYALALLLGLAVFGFGLSIALERRLIAGVDARLEQRLEGLRRAFGANPEVTDRAQLQWELSDTAGEIPEGGLIQLRDRDGAVMLPAPGQPVFPAEPAQTFSLNGRNYRTRTARINCFGETFETVVAQSLDEPENIMREFRSLLLLFIPAALLMASLGGYWLSLRALRPVDAITKVARSIGVNNLSQRLAVPRTGDELERMAEAWNGVLERLDESVQRMRQFTADASHEIRTPVAVIRATAELAARRERQPEEYRQALKTIETVAAHMTELTEDLLALARADGGQRMPLAPADVSALPHSMVRQNQARAAERQIALRSAAVHQPVLAMANESGLQRLLLILVDNALRHTPAGGSITVGVAEQASGITLFVEDTGPGIAADVLPHIFERFYRGDPSRASGSGFGLGLSIAQTIADAHGSKIVVDTKPGAGARFSVTLRAASSFSEIADAGAIVSSRRDL